MKVSKMVRLLFALLLITLPGIAVAQESGSSQSETPGLNGLIVSDTSLSFTLVSEAATIGVDGEVRAEGLAAYTTTPGEPTVPYYSALIALPPEANVVVDVTADDWQLTKVDFVRPGPSPQRFDFAALDGPTLGVRDLSADYVINEAVYATDGAFPATLSAVSEPLYQRDVRLVRLALYPVNYNPARQELTQATRLQVSVRFTDADFSSLRPAPSADSSVEAGLAATVVNYDQSKNWRSLPASLAPSGPALPIGVTAYKLELNTDGIYEVTQDELVAVNSAIANSDPATLQMMHRGNPVAFEFIGDADNQFESGESVRFYGFEYDYGAVENQYVKTNVFWIWAGGTATNIPSQANNTGAATATTFAESTTRNDDLFYYGTFTNAWEFFPNEPEAWFWSSITIADNVTEVKSPFVDLYDPAPAGPPVTVTVEYTSQPNPLVGGTYQPHIANVALTANNAYSSSLSWFGVPTPNFPANVNVVLSGVPQNELVDGQNRVTLSASTNTTGGLQDVLFLNRITWDYTRMTIARGDELHLDYAGSARTYDVSGFTTNNPLVYEVSDPLNPVRINNPAVSGGAGNFTYSFGNGAATAAYFAATETAVRSVATIGHYTAPNIDPAGGADWVAVSYVDYLDEIAPLVAYRQSAIGGAHSTHVVDIEDIVNQYGFGLPIPDGLNNYLTYALLNWGTPPSYVTLVGDTTYDPRELEGAHPENQVYTHLLFADRFQGHIPSDSTFTFLVPEAPVALEGMPSTDFLSDVALGRIPGATEAEVTLIVDKILKFEQNGAAPQPWMENMMFVSDNTDAGGDFCSENASTAALLPPNFTTEQICQIDPSTAGATAVGDAMYDFIDTSGALMLNYRGHGSPTSWAKTIASAVEGDTRFLNEERPMMILSADCLDGYFVLTNNEGLGESFMQANNAGPSMDNVGSAIHWSSSGLGFSFEHTIMHSNFYEGMFDNSITRVGDTVNYAKSEYIAGGIGDISEVVAFTLLGDPATELARPDYHVEKTSLDPIVSAGATVRFRLEARNEGIYPGEATIVDNLPTELTYVSATSNVPITPTMGAGNVLTIEVGELHYFSTANPTGTETAVITVTTQLNGGVNNVLLTNTAAISGQGQDFDSTDNSASSNVSVGTPTTIIALSSHAANVIHWETTFVILLAALLMVTLTLAGARRRRRV